MTLDKVVGSAREAVSDIPSGARLAVGGFGLCGIPMVLIQALLDAASDKLTTEELIKLGVEVAVNHKDVADVAAAWLTAQGLVQ